MAGGPAQAEYELRRAAFLGWDSREAAARPAGLGPAGLAGLLTRPATEWTVHCVAARPSRWTGAVDARMTTLSEAYRCWWKVPYGYRRIPRRDGVPAHVEVSEPEAHVVRQIFRWHVDEHLSVRQIALRLTESAHVTATGLPRWGISTVTRMLHNEAYIGTMYYNRHESVSCDPRSTSRRRPTRLQERPTAEWIPLPVPPIIDGGGIGGRTRPRDGRRPVPGSVQDSR